MPVLTVNGKPRATTPPAATGGTTSSGGTTPPAPAAPPALSGVTWHQAYALDPAAQDATVVGYLRPVGGIGPFTYSISGNSGYNLADGNGLVRVLFYAPNSQGATFQATVTDGRGVTSPPITVTVNVAASGPITTINDPLPATNCTKNPTNAPIFRLQGGGTVLDRTTGAASAQWSTQYDYIRSANGLPALGTYPLTIQYPGRPDFVFDVPLVAYTPIGYIEFNPSVVSTSMLANSGIGKALATTPNNSPYWTVQDPSGTVQTTTGGDFSVAKQPAAVGPLTFSITVYDNNASYTKSITIQVVQGNTLAPSNMSFANCATGCTNDVYNFAIGVPVVAGIAGTPQWSLVSQTGFNPVAVSSGVPARYTIAASSGAMAAQTILSGNLDGVSSAIDTLMVSCTDGVNTCTAPFNFAVSWAAISKTLHVGRGKSVAAGLGGPNPSGYETMAAARYQCMTAHAGTYHMLVYADADPDYYTNDNGTKTQDYSLRYPWQGPIIIEGVAANGVTMPRMGGAASLNAPGGQDMRGKGFFVSGDGDAVFKNLEISGCHDAYSDGVHGVEAIRKDGAVAGNITVQRCWLHDNDNNFLTAFGQQQGLIEYNFFENGGTSHVSSGACHNAYLGEMTRVVFRNNVSRRVNVGHLVKSRAQIVEIYYNRFIDGLTGTASACIELPFAGQASIYSNVVEKGGMAFGPDAIRYGAEGMPWDVNTLTVHDNTVSVLTLPGSHYGTPSFVGFFYGTSPTGVPATATIANNSLWLGAGVSKFNFYGAANATITDTGTTMLAAPPALDETRPDVSGSMPAPQFMYRLQGQDDFSNGAPNSIQGGVQQIGDRDQIQISASGTAGGTVICNLRASNDLGAQGTSGGSVGNPFAAGTTWAISTAGTYYGNTPWAAAGKYAVTANSDGTAALKVSGALAKGVDYVQLLATAPGGQTALYRYPIVVV